jgi:hypothetical protein
MKCLSKTHLLALSTFLLLASTNINSASATAETSSAEDDSAPHEYATAVEILKNEIEELKAKKFAKREELKKQEDGSQIQSLVCEIEKIEEKINLLSQALGKIKDDSKTTETLRQEKRFYGFAAIGLASLTIICPSLLCAYPTKIIIATAIGCIIIQRGCHTGWRQWLCGKFNAQRQLLTG